MFEGPLDLLLHLIEREELDITRVSLVLVADQYLEYLALMQEISASNLAEFLVVAAKLLVIKSRSLLPRVGGDDEEEEEDPADALARQLIEYKRFKEVAAQLKDIEQGGGRAYPRIAPPPHFERRLEPGDVSIAELLDAFKRALEAHPPAPPVDDVVAPVVVHIADCIRTLERLTKKQDRVRLSRVLRSARSRVEVIVFFLAVLEMVKQQRLEASQEFAFGEIYLAAREPDPDAEIAPLDLSEYGEQEYDQATEA